MRDEQANGFWALVGLVTITIGLVVEFASAWPVVGLGVACVIVACVP